MLKEITLFGLWISWETDIVDIALPFHIEFFGPKLTDEVERGFAFSFLCFSIRIGKPVNGGWGEI